MQHKTVSRGIHRDEKDAMHGSTRSRFPDQLLLLRCYFGSLNLAKSRKSPGDLT